MPQPTPRVPRAHSAWAMMVMQVLEEKLLDYRMHFMSTLSASEETGVGKKPRRLSANDVLELHRNRRKRSTTFDVFLVSISYPPRKQVTKKAPSIRAESFYGVPQGQFNQHYPSGYSENTSIPEDIDEEGVTSTATHYLESAISQNAPQRLRNVFQSVAEDSVVPVALSRKKSLLPSSRESLKRRGAHHRTPSETSRLSTSDDKVTLRRLDGMKMHLKNVDTGAGGLLMPGDRSLPPKSASRFSLIHVPSQSSINVQPSYPPPPLSAGSKPSLTRKASTRSVLPNPSLLSVADKPAKKRFSLMNFGRR